MEDSFYIYFFKGERVNKCLHLLIYYYCFWCCLLWIELILLICFSFLFIFIHSFWFTHFKNAWALFSFSECHFTHSSSDCLATKILPSSILWDLRRQQRQTSAHSSVWGGERKRRHWKSSLCSPGRRLLCHGSVRSLMVFAVRRQTLSQGFV